LDSPISAFPGYAASPAGRRKYTLSGGGAGMLANAINDWLTADA